ncbi:MAG: hypothetical protein IPI38_18765 [Gemmatimonadetes bacterium]|nr:hypothetical protein [Gemmatimonadota bacterium]
MGGERQRQLLAAATTARRWWAQTLTFAAPGFGAGRFQNVIIANSAGGVIATSDLYATGTAGVTPTAVRTLSGNGSTLFTTILSVSNFTFNNLLSTSTAARW